jgi:DNA-binding HxlR family transcriptional regulator
MAASDQHSKAGCSSPRVIAAILLLQEKWNLFIVQSLLEHPLGFNEMARRAGPVNATTLAQRVGQLERAGVLAKTVHSTMPPRTSYALTEAGQALAPVLDAIATWAERYVTEPAAACEDEPQAATSLLVATPINAVSGRRPAPRS